MFHLSFRGLFLSSRLIAKRGSQPKACHHYIWKSQRWKL